MDKLTIQAAQKVEEVRAQWHCTEADVFVSSGGDALVWGDPFNIIHVDTHGTVSTYQLSDDE